MDWKQAIIKVLQESNEPMNYADIAEEVAEKKYRQPDELGATPANTVNSIINQSLRNEGPSSLFVKVASGIYALRQASQQNTPDEIDQTATSRKTGIINALGMFWERNNVVWKTEPELWGTQQQNSKRINFCSQKGIYLLHDTQGVVYVGRATDQTLGRRLQQHTVDRLNGRWNRFSWFGIYPPNDDGSLKTGAIDLSQVEINVVISTLEAVLIEGLEPRQNRKRGDDFQAVEFLQAEDPSIEKERTRSIFRDLQRRLDL